MIILTDEARGVSVPVELKQWTPSGRVQVGGIFVTEPGHHIGGFFPVEVFRLRHTDGPRALAAALRGLPS